MAATLSRRYYATRDEMRACAASFLGLAISNVAEWARRLARAGAVKAGDEAPERKRDHEIHPGGHQAVQT
jgi:hypothetical protein